MKHTILISFILIYSMVYAQTPNWMWAKSHGSIGYDQGSNITTDNHGHVYMTGFFGSPTVSFGSTTLTSTGTDGDIFITQYDTLGNVIWARTAVGNTSDWSNDVITDTSGNIYITGVFTSDTITFGSTMLFNAVTSSFSPRNDIFIVKYDSYGNVIWAKSIGGDGNDVGYGIATDNNGNVYVTGSFSSSTLTFGSTVLTNTGASSSDIFITKLDASSGNITWAKSAGGNATSTYESGEAVATDGNGNIYITGTFTCASLSFGSYTLTNVGTNNAFFIAKYDASGNALWADGAGGTYSDFAENITTDASGNIYVTGQYSSATLSLGTYTLTNTAATASDIFIIKYNSSGSVLWANSAGGGNNDYATSIATDANENVYITGSFWSPTATFGSTVLTRVGGDDIFVAKYNTSSGNIMWAMGAGGNNSDYAQSIAIDSEGNTFIGGFFYSSSLPLGSSTLNNPTGGAAGKTDMFIGKLNATQTNVSIKEANTNSFFVYPNPATNFIIVENNNFLSTINLNFELIDITGRIIFKEKIEHSRNIYTIEGIEPGIYFYTIHNNNQTLNSNKIVIY